jgi:hypothetical protein
MTVDHSPDTSKSRSNCFEKGSFRLPSLHADLWSCIQGCDTTLPITDHEKIIEAYESTTHLAERSVDYYRYATSVKLAPVISELQRRTEFEDEEIEMFQEMIVDGMKPLLQDSLAALDMNYRNRMHGEVAGIINEITPIILYTSGDTIVLPASVDEDKHEKTDLRAIRFAGNKLQRNQAIQCKSSMKYNFFTKGVATIAATDFGNGFYNAPTGEDYATSRALVSGNIEMSDDALATIETYRSHFWPTVDERLLYDSRIAHNSMARIATREIFAKSHQMQEGLRRWVNTYSA